MRGLRAAGGAIAIAMIAGVLGVAPANAATPAPLTWIKLGAATSADIKTLAATLKPTDIMDVRTVDPLDAGYTKVKANGRTEWIPPPHLDRGARTNDYHHPERLFADDEDDEGP